MEIKGINAVDEFFDEDAVSVQTLINNLKKHSDLKYYSLEKYYKIIEKLYETIFSSNPGRQETAIISHGTLFHRSPIRDAKTGEVYYDKIESIAQNGLLPVDMLVENSDATDPTYLSCHSVLEGEETLDDIFERSPQGSIDLIFFINTNTPAIQKLISIGRFNGEDYHPPKFAELLSNGSADEVLKKIFQVANCYCPDNINQKGVCYLPIGVPATYISAVVVPDELLHDEKLIKILTEKFANAVILDKNGNEATRNVKRKLK